MLSATMQCIHMRACVVYFVLRIDTSGGGMNFGTLFH